MNNDFQLQQEFLEQLANAYSIFDSSAIEPYLAYNFTHTSMWVLTDITSKKEYLDYLSAKLRTMKNASVNNKFRIVYDKRDGRPYLICNQKTPEGDFGLFEAKTENGKIIQVALMASSLYPIDRDIDFQS